MNVLGTKCQCDVCQLQVVVIKGGAGTLVCHGAPMRVIAGSVASGAERPNANVGDTEDNDVEYF